MKTCRYIVEIEMPDGDMVSANWLKDIIQHDCDSEDKERKKVSVRELDLPEGLDEAADTYSENIIANGEDMFDAIADGFRAGAELVMTRIKWKKPQDCHLKNFTEVVVRTKDGSVYFNAQFDDGDFRIWGDEWWEKIDEEIAGWIPQEDVESLLRWSSCL